MAFPVTRILDTFNRADEEPITGWTDSSGDGLRVSSNLCLAGTGVGTGGSASWGVSFAVNQEGYFTWSTITAPGTDAIYVYLRLQTDSDYLSDHYETEFVTASGANNDVVAFWKRVGGVWTQLGADTALGTDYVIGDQLGGRIIGSEITAWRNGVQVGSRTDTDITLAGFIGLYVGDPLTTADDFGGGAFTGIPLEYPVHPRRRTHLRM